MKNLVAIFYAHIPERFDPSDFDHYLSQLPANIQEKIKGFQRWQDAQASLAGNVLLTYGLNSLNIKDLQLQDLCYDPFLRPYFNHSIDFNISHSGEYAVCAISEDLKVGIDIERIKPIDLDDFKTQWTDQEQTAIMQSENRLYAFYDLWTKKEAVIKADGRGLSIPLKNISIEHNRAFVEGKCWYLQKIELAREYVGHLAVDTEKYRLQIEVLNFYQEKERYSRMPGSRLSE